MSKVSIKATDNGPFLVNGEVEIVDGQGKSLEVHEECYLCRCGLSTDPPYCTGAHEGKFQSQVRS